MAAVLATAVSGGLPQAVHLAEDWISSSPAQKVAASPTVKRPSVARTKEIRRRGRRTAVVHGALFGPPLKEVSEYPLDSWEVRAWTFPREFEPSSGQITQIDHDRHQPALVNRDLYDDGGYPISTDTQFIVENERPYWVTVINIQVLKKCGRPLDGPIFVGQARLTETGLADTGTQLGINLDSPNPAAMLAAGWNVSKWTQEYASDAPVRIAGGGTHEFDIRTIALYHACSFWIQFTVVDGGKVRYQTFSDGGQPFRVGALMSDVVEKKNHSRPFVGYRELYVGGSASPGSDGAWTRENPRTWH